MHLVQLLLPLYSNSGAAFEPTLYTQVRDELVDRFGGITTYTRAPMKGLWQESNQVVHDDLIIYEIMVENLEEKWWREYRISLEHRFQQESLIVRAHRVLLI